MDKYLTIFGSHSQYVNPEVKPNVSYCIQENEVHYNPIDWSKEYFTIESLEDNNTIYLKASNASITKTVSVSTDNGETWTEYTSSNSSSGTALATLDTGEKLLVKGENTTYATVSYYNQFKSTGQFEVKGNIMSLVNGDSFANSDRLASYALYNLFSDCSGLTSAGNLVLPATTLADFCYFYMFNNCTNLTTAPNILPATTLAYCCCDNMFRGCTSLTTAPELPTTTLASYCYENMFYGCTSLTTAPQLPATTLVGGCYAGMFNGCTNLNYIKAMFTTAPSTTYMNNWVNGVSNTGTFIKNSAATWENTFGSSAIPKSTTYKWTVETAAA